MKRGISFKVPNEYGHLLCKVLDKINIADYHWKITYDQVFKNNSHFLFNDSEYDGKEFKDIICSAKASYNAFLLSLQGALKKEQNIEVKTYEEYLKSQVLIIMLVADSEWVDIYCKNNSIIEQIKQNAEHNKFDNIEYITDENDTRYKLGV